MNRVLRGAVASGVLLFVACTQSSPAPAPTSTATPSPTPATRGEESSVTSRDLGAPDPQSLPEALAPGGLGHLRLPADSDSIVAVFAQLPPKVAGRPRSTRFDQRGPSEYTASYGEAGPEDCSPLRLQARDVSTGDFYPIDWTADVLIAWWTLGADWEVDAAGREGSLFWVRWNTTCSSEPSLVVFPVFSLLWGSTRSPWVFSAQADTPGELNALIEAFVASASD